MYLEGKTRHPTVTDREILGFFGEYRFLSNYHPVDIALDGLVYPSTEHAYVAQKTADPALRAYIAGLPGPQAARTFGKTLQLVPQWDAIRLEAMDRVLQLKFAQPTLGAALLATGERYLEETNNWNDRFYGVCAGRGMNHLGLMLMRIRQQLRKAPSAQFSLPL